MQHGGPVEPEGGEPEGLLCVSPWEDLCQLFPDVTVLHLGLLSCVPACSISLILLLIRAPSFVFVSPRSLCSSPSQVFSTKMTVSGGGGLEVPPDGGETG